MHNLSASYAGDDVLGYPLKPLSPSYTQTVTADLHINAGGLFTSWNPISHTEYWTNNDSQNPSHNSSLIW
jgi:hypothetical protein